MDEKKYQVVLFPLIYDIVYSAKTHQAKIPTLLNRELSSYQAVYVLSF